MKNALLALGLMMACVSTVSAQPPKTDQPQDQEWAEKMFGAAENLVHDFGAVPHGAVLRHDFVMTNIFTAPVEISQIRISSCTSALLNRATATADKHLLQPNEKTTIRVRLVACCATGQKWGPIYVNVVRNKDQFSQARLMTSAFIREEIACNPGEAAFGSVAHGQTPSQTVDVEYAGVDEWRVNEVVVPKEAPFEATVKELYRHPDKVAYQVKVSLKKDAVEGSFQENILLKTNEPKAAPLSLLVSGKIQ